MPTAKIDMAAASSNQVIAAPGAGRIIQIWGMVVIASGTVNVTFQSGSTALSGAMALTAQAGFSAFPCNEPLFTTNVNEAFNILESAGIQLSGFVTYTVKGA